MLTQDFETISEIFGLFTHGEASRNRELLAYSKVGIEKRHETFRSKPEDGITLPHVILPEAGDTEDFFATVATYYQDKSPISALAYVLGGDTVNLFDQQHKTLEMRFTNNNRMFRIACLGAAIGEATLAGLATRAPSGEATYSSCRRTLAFALCRATLLFESELQPESLAEKWITLRKLTGLKVSPPVSEAVLLVNEFASGSIRSSRLSILDNQLREVLRKLSSRVDHNNDLLVSVLTDLYPGTSRFFREMNGVFDGRMFAFTRLVDAIQANSRGTRIDEIAVAAACNLILPGSFAHTSVLEKLVEFYPAALVWYGYFSAISGASASQMPNSGLIAKLERDLLEAFSFEQRPRCDISLEEFEVLSRTQLRAENIRPSQQRTLLVSLLPGVDVYTRFGTESDTVAERPRREEETAELHERLSVLLEEALFTLKNAGNASKSAPAKRKSKKIR